MFFSRYNSTQENIIKCLLAFLFGSRHVILVHVEYGAVGCSGVLYYRKIPVKLKWKIYGV